MEGLAHAQADVELRVWLLEPGPLEEWLRDTGCVAVARVPNAGRMARVAWLRRHLRSEVFDVLHAHGLVAEVLGGMATAAGGRTRLVSTVHRLPGDHPWRAPGRSPTAALALWASRRFASARLIAVTEDICAQLRRVGLPASRLAHVPNGVPGAPSCGERAGTFAPSPICARP